MALIFSNDKLNDVTNPASYADLRIIEASDWIGVVNKIGFCLDSHIFNCLSFDFRIH